MGGVTRISQTEARISAGSKPFAKALAQWLLRFGRLEAAKAAKSPAAYVRGVRKQKDDAPKLASDLESLLLRFGLRQAIDASTKAAGGVVVPAGIYRDALAGKKVKIKWFWELREGVIQRVHDITEETKERARASVKVIIAQSLTEETKPSVGEVARRIRTAFTGPGDVEREGRVHTRDAEHAYVFSPERAAIIARTELAQAENTGIFEGYKATGVQQIEWIARTDGRSGDRHHELQNGKTVKIGELFTMPSGVRMRYPADPRGPISENANCRCTIRPLLRTKGG